MKTQRSLRQVIKAAPGTLVLALALVSLGTAAAAAAGHGTSGHVHASARQSTDRQVSPARDDAAKSCMIPSTPWMYTATVGGPWIADVSAVNRTPWMYTVLIGKPLAHAPQVRKTTVAHGCRKALLSS